MPLHTSMHPPRSSAPRRVSIRVFTAVFVTANVLFACSGALPECPHDDADPCTLDECKAGIAVNNYLGDGHPCFVGKLQGACSDGRCAIPCESAAQCNDGIPCTSGACQGGICVIEVDDGQTAPEDGNACTEEHCVGGDVVSWQKPDGSPCGGSECVGGLCGQCATAADCGMDTECSEWECKGAKCVALDAGTLTPVLAGAVQGDCKQYVCDGDGGVIVAANPADTPADFNPCFVWQCVGTTPLRVPSIGTKCVMDSGLIGYCSPDGACVQCIQDMDCGPDFMCEAHTCLKCGEDNPTGAEICGGSCGECIGTTCDADSQCAAGHCAGTNAIPAKICCDAACDGVCQQCSVSGTCGPVAWGQQDADTCYFPDMACAGTQCRYKTGHPCSLHIHCVSNICDNITKTCK